MKITCEIYSRVSGYYRPVSQFNLGKQEEQRERRYLKYYVREGEVLDKSRGNGIAVYEHGNLQSPVCEAFN